jgi:hypothetical protein
MLTLLFWMLAGLLGLKIGWNFAIMVYLWVYLRRNVRLYPRGVDLYLFVEWVLLLVLTLMWMWGDGLSGSVILASLIGILLSYGHGFLLLRWMRHFAQRNDIAE